MQDGQKQMDITTERKMRRAAGWADITRYLKAKAEQIIDEHVETLMLEGHEPGDDIELSLRLAWLAKQ